MSVPALSGRCLRGVLHYGVELFGHSTADVFHGLPGSLLMQNIINGGTPYGHI
uniref:Uncharacterized protein n=1 Tax=Anguilla anguilla TaxID=7936 RepID=A0A0E9UT77_ANGAN